MVKCVFRDYAIELGQEGEGPKRMPFQEPCLIHSCGGGSFKDLTLISKAFGNQIAEQLQQLNYWAEIRGRMPIPGKREDKKSVRVMELVSNDFLRDNKGLVVESAPYNYIVVPQIVII